MNTRPASDEALRQSQYSNAANLNARIRIHQQFSTAVESWDDFILSNLHFHPGQTVLELGCGNASQTRHNRGAYPALLHYLLADFSFGMMQEAISELNEDARFSFSVQDAQALALPADSFDFISANHMLYHVPDIKLALREIHRLLKPGGRLMAATNGRGQMHDLDQLVVSFYPGSKELHTFHSRFNLEEGLRLVKSVFGNCSLKPYISDLWVTEAQPLTDYVLSLDGFLNSPTSQNPHELTRYFQKFIDLEGGIKIRKSTGLLLATK
jgi:ubiquinone/menaquinone biosynthesis C-methylase UbiE